ncbi:MULTISPECIES: helix-turn-helix transcriptional regulator [Delftia]|uniref:AlpA family phage regulatory protein n=1 Tax=Delftia lacustris TaxID=558537 RepID=A0A7T2YVW5_9BURK|nr:MULTISPECIES: AlpA family phage regulatory protein [Delftia]EPD42369.1 prophage regulatory protein [Delftia acidovorans CCUG 15835]QPS83117.1 AlpA family phage regulatory protein [Delftia lacustris]
MEFEVEQLSPASNTADIDAGQSLPLPGTAAYEALPQFPKRSPLPFRRTIRRRELRQMVPLAETTIYEMERRGEFPRRFNLTPRCVVWDLAEVEVWIEERKQAPRGGISKPDVHLRKTRPVRAGSSEESSRLPIRTIDAR